MKIISTVFRKLADLKLMITNEGLFLAMIFYGRMFMSRMFTIAVFQRRDIYIDFTAKLIGCKHIDVGRRFSAGRHLWLETVTEYGNDKFNPRIVIKDNVSMSDFNHIGAVNYVEIGNGVLFGSKCYVTDHNHGIYIGNNISSPELSPVLRDLTNNQKVIIGDNVWLGDNAVVLPGVTIGKGSIIGANAVVTKDIPEYSIAVGIPARVVKKWSFITEKWEVIREINDELHKAK